MIRFFKIIAVLILAGLLAAGGWFAGKSESISPAPTEVDNAVWIAAGVAPTVISGSGPALEAEYLAAKATALSLQLSLESAKHAIEEALPMVQEQKDNYDFAEERYNRLMPLVEKGTLDLMTASQIQSAYISARASLSQAKFYLGQAQREYGTPETRKVLIQAAESKAEAAKQQVEAQKNNAALSNANERALPDGKILAFFPESVSSKLSPGASARVEISGQKLDAIVNQVSKGVVTLELTVPPIQILPAAARCHVEILPK